MRMNCEIFYLRAFVILKSAKIYFCLHKPIALLNPLSPDGSYMIHGSYDRNNCREAKGLLDNANFLFTKKLIGRLNADRPLLIYQP